MGNDKEKNSLFEKHRENIYFRWGVTAFVVLAACVVLAQFVDKLPAVFGWFRTLLQALAPAIYGLGIAYLLDPIVTRIQLLIQPRLQKWIPSENRSTVLARALGVLLSLVLVLVIIWALIAMVLPQLLESVNTIIGNLPNYYNTLRGWIMDKIDSNLEFADFTNEIMQEVYNYLSNWLSTSLLPRVQNIVVTLTSSVVGMARAMLHLVIGLIISIYLLMGKKRFLAQAKKLTYALLGTRRGGYLCNVCTFANRAFGGFIGGKIVDSAIIGVLCFIGMQILRLPYALLISIIVGVTNIIPFFGPYLGAIPSALLLLVIRPLDALTFVIFILVLQQLDGNIIGPMILGDATGLSGFWVVVSILVFGSFYGVLGMIIGVPLFAVIYQILSDITNRLLRRRGLSTETTDYSEWNYPPRPEADHWHRPRNRGLGRLRKRSKTSAPEEPASPEQPEASETPASESDAESE